MILKRKNVPGCLKCIILDEPPVGILATRDNIFQKWKVTIQTGIIPSDVNRNSPLLKKL